MPKEEWGVKRVCPETSKRFYDLNADPITSPYTGETYPLSFFTNDKSKATMADKADKAALKEAAEEELSNDVDVLDDEDDTAEAATGDDLLEDDDDDTVALEEIADVAAPEEDS